MLLHDRLGRLQSRIHTRLHSRNRDGIGASIPGEIKILYFWVVDFRAHVLAADLINEELLIQVRLEESVIPLDIAVGIPPAGPHVDRNIASKLVQDGKGSVDQLVVARHPVDYGKLDPSKRLRARA